MPRRRQLDEIALQSLFRRDQRVATHAELVALGMGLSTITYRIRPEGPWSKLLPGVIVAQSGAPSRRQRLVGGLKYAGEGAVVTGMTALREYGFRTATTHAAVHVLIPHESRRNGREYVITERTTRLPEPVVRGGIPYAGVARAVIDACRRLTDLDVVRGLVAEAVQSERCTPHELTAEIAEGNARGSGLPRRVMTEIDAGIRSVAEAKTREAVIASDLPAFEFNVALEDSAGRLIAVVDGYSEEYGVAYELDSLTWHLDPASYKRTQRRQRLLTLHGVFVVPVAPGDVARDTAEFIGSLRGAVRAAEGRPTPDVRIRRQHPGAA